MTMEPSYIQFYFQVINWAFGFVHAICNILVVVLVLFFYRRAVDFGE